MIGLLGNVDLIEHGFSLHGGGTDLTGNPRQQTHENASPRMGLGLRSSTFEDSVRTGFS